MFNFWISKRITFNRPYFWILRKFNDFYSELACKCTIWNTCYNLFFWFISYGPRNINIIWDIGDTNDTSSFILLIDQINNLKFAYFFLDVCNWNIEWKFLYKIQWIFSNILQNIFFNIFWIFSKNWIFKKVWWSIFF